MTWDSNGNIDGGANVNHVDDGDIHVSGKIDGGSYVILVSNHGSITVDGKVDGGSSVSLTAAGDILIGVVGGDGDKKIDGNSHVDATSGGSISLGNKIDGQHTSVDFKACKGISIGNKIDGGATVRLMTATGSIDVGDKIDNGATVVDFWPPGSLQVAGGIHGGADVTPVEWAQPDGRCAEGPSVVGYWWQNWPHTFGYVSPPRSFPRSLAEIVDAVVGVAGADQALKAVGGGWSFTDASLPFRTQAEVDQASIVLKGASATQDLSHILQGMNGVTASPMDLVPEAVADDLTFSSHYDQPSLTELTSSGSNLPGSGSVRLIDTRSLASSLQVHLPAILSGEAKRKHEAGTYYFFVEAGITMADLDQLLDHQSPRMAIQASGGSPGATLAGTLSTATHGGEFRWPLLVDRVRAIHLVGPGGEQWWIEGEHSVAEQTALHKLYPKLDAAHFIGGSWTGVPGLTAQDALNAAIVSMGTMGVIYSVVLEVVPQFGLEQIVTASSWSSILDIAHTSRQQLRDGSREANQAVLDVILDGGRNGTGVGESENVYADLAINPFNMDCWFTNRRVTPELPVDANGKATSIGDYLSALSLTLSSHAVDTVKDSKFVGRLFDFLCWATDVPSINLSDDINDANQAGTLFSFITRYPDVMVSALATMNVQAVANAVNASDHPDRGQQFLGDLLSGFFHALQGTTGGVNSDRTDISYKVGAIGWPDGGLPGRGLEIALDPTVAFTFLQTVLLDDIVQNTMVGENKPLIGYISIRVCPPTATFMGMQQFSPFSIMIEVVGYRSPEANLVMDRIQQRVLELNASGDLRAMLHWGLENQMMSAGDLANTPLQDVIRPTSPFTRLEAFKAVRKYLVDGKPRVFDNNFVRRLQL